MVRNIYITFLNMCSSTLPVVTTPAPCVDVLPNCDSYGQYYCQNKEFVAWVNKNCRKYCGICSKYTMHVPVYVSTVNGKHKLRKMVYW